LTTTERSQRSSRSGRSRSTTCSTTPASCGLWEDPVGWNGYVREIVDGEPRYYSVNTRFDEDEWISKIRCGERAVRDAVEKHIEDPKAGRAGGSFGGVHRHERRDCR